MGILSFPSMLKTTNQQIVQSYLGKDAGSIRKRAAAGTPTTVFSLCTGHERSSHHRQRHPHRYHKNVLTRLMGELVIPCLNLPARTAGPIDKTASEVAVMQLMRRRHVAVPRILG